MNKFIEYIKKFFSKLFKKNLELGEGENVVDNALKSNNKEDEFLNSIKVDNKEDDIFVLQAKLENGVISESDLNSKQIINLKKLYCKQILELHKFLSKYN